MDIHPASQECRKGVDLMKSYGLLLLSILILVGCATGTNRNNGTSKILTPTKIQAQTTSEEQETEQSKPPAQQITETQLPQSTTPDETIKSNNVLGKQLAVAVEFPNQAIVVFDFDSGESRRLRENESIVFLDWVDKGCGLIIGETTDDVGSIYKIDLQGNFLEEITNYDFRHIEGYLWPGVSDIYLSSSGEFAAYIISAYEDDSFRDPNIFNLYISKVDEPDSMIAISQNDGVYDISWSPNGSFIAFTDYDDFGIHQLYVSSPEKAEKYQLTNFSKPDGIIQHITWSPNSEFIAFNYVIRKEGGGILENNIVIGAVQDFEINSKTINSIEGKEFERVQNIWWEEDNIIVLDIIDSFSGKSTSGIYWINTQTDSVIQKVLQEDVGSLSGPWSKAILSDSHLGLLIQPEFWIFDLEEREVIAKTQMPVDLASSWYLAPPDFPGEAYCN